MFKLKYLEPTELSLDNNEFYVIDYDSEEFFQPVKLKELSLDYLYFVIGVTNKGYYKVCQSSFEFDSLEQKLACDYLQSHNLTFYPQDYYLRLAEKKTDFLGYVDTDKMIKSLFQSGQNLLRAREELAEYHFPKDLVDSESLVNDLSYTDNFDDITVRKDVDVTDVDLAMQFFAKKELQARQELDSIRKSAENVQLQTAFDNAVQKAVEELKKSE